MEASQRQSPRRAVNRSQPERATGAGRGRPRGSPSLTREREERIISFVLSGATPAAVAKAVGISPRTLRDWVARGEDRHPARSCTPKLRRFAIRFREAEGAARVVAENSVYTHHPKVWLARTVRSTPDDDGWSDAPVGPGDHRVVAPEIHAMTEEELNGALLRLLVAFGLVGDPEETTGTTSAGEAS